MKKILCVLAIAVLFSAVCFAKEKTFTKEATEVVPPSQSQDQVIAYLTQKLTREATEEAGTFITSELNMKNYEITKDEFTSFAGAISKVKVEKKESFMKDKQQYVKVKLKITVDTDNIKTYLDKIVQDKEYKKEAEALRKQNLELEEKLKTATKKQYEQELSAKVQQQMELQKQRELELDKMAIQAKEELAKVKEEQNKKQQEREQELLKLKEQIAKEKDNIKKAELENQAKIKELENQAKENIANRNSSQDTNSMYIEQAVEEATKTKQETSKIIGNFEILIRNNRENLIKSYDEQKNLLTDMSAKGQWETAEKYNERLNNNEQIKKKVEKEKAQGIFESNKNALESMLTTLEPFKNNLEKIQKGSYYSQSREKAIINSMDEINVDEGYFYMKVMYKDREYRLGFIFNNPEIGIEKAQLIYQTPNQFVIEPFFFIDNNLTQTVKGFYGIHLGTNIEKTWDFYKDRNIQEDYKFYELKKIEKYKEVYDILNDIEYYSNDDIVKNKLWKIKSSDILDVDKYIQEYKDLKLGENISSVSVGYYRVLALKSNGTVVDSYEHKEIESWRNIVGLAQGFAHIVGLKRDGTVVVDGVQKYGVCNVENWKNIKAVYANPWNTIGLKKDGTVVACGSNYFGQLNGLSSWKNVTKIVTDSFCIAGLKKDGSVVYSGYPLDSLISVRNWKNIKDIVISGDPNGDQPLAVKGKNYGGKVFNNDTAIFGLKKDGTVVIAGNSKYKQINIANWKDIVAISVSPGWGKYKYMLGLKKDGTVVYSGPAGKEESNVSKWKDIVKVCACIGESLGLTKDGMVVTTSTLSQDIDFIKDLNNYFVIKDIYFSPNGVVFLTNVGFIRAYRFYNSTEINKLNFR